MRQKARDILKNAIVSTNQQHSHDNDDDGLNIDEIFQQCLMLCDSEVRWEHRHGGFLGCCALISSLNVNERDRVVSVCQQHLDDDESRVRLAVADTLEELSVCNGVSVYVKIKDDLMNIIHRNFEREERAVNDNDEQQNGVAADEDVTSLFRKKSKVNPDLANIKHDTEGWKSLETAFSTLQRVMAGAQRAFLPHLDESMLQLIFKSVRHKNRFVRETGYKACATIAEICDEESLERLSPTLTAILSNGLSDNWSQVRFSASVAARKYLECASGDYKRKYFNALLPAMCLNRYYVAEGVRLYSIETWRSCFGEQGKQLVADYIADIVPYYIKQSQADNHAVREAACHCIAELGAKVDASAVLPHVRELLDALLVCFRDESWPVRDAACVACGNFVSAFPDASRTSLHDLYHLWFEHLSDNIPSVREGSAMALGKVLFAYKDEAVEVIMKHLNDALPSVREQTADSKKYTALSNTTEFGVAAKRVRDNDPAIHTNQVAYSCGSLAPKLRRGGGCMDHSFRRPSEPWERTDGCIYLMSAIAEYDGTLVAPLFETLADMVSLRHYSHHVNMLENFCTQVPIMAERMNKKVFKRHMQCLIDPIFRALQCENNLTMHAAGSCLSRLAKYVGPSILRGRLSPQQRELYDTSPVIHI